MYIATVIGLMFIFPLASIIIESCLKHHGVLESLVVGKWFVFWAVGVRLITAGLRQIVQPRFTAETILGIKDPDAVLIVRELGFANIAIGSVGLGSVFLFDWILPVAIIGTVFYGLAGMNHVTYKRRSILQNVAMTSDLLAAAVLLSICLVMTRHGVVIPDVTLARHR